MINDRNVQESIRNGYALGYYGHHARRKDKNYIPSELDNQGQKVAPIVKTKSLKISGKIITHTQEIIMSMPNAKMVLDMIKNSIGGFSFVMNIDDKKFLGADYVLAPNFNGNRVITDSICAGECLIENELYMIMDEVPGHLKSFVKDEFLSSYDEVEGAYKIKEAMDKKDSQISALMDEITNLKEDSTRLSELKYKLRNENIIVSDDLDITYADDLSKLFKTNNGISLDDIENMNIIRHKPSEKVKKTTENLNQYRKLY